MPYDLVDKKICLRPWNVPRQKLHTRSRSLRRNL